MKFASKLLNKLKCLTMIVLVSTVVSCDSWLDLGSEDRIMENTLFSSQAGFMTALNGVYIELLSSNLYGGTLSYKTFVFLRNTMIVIKVNKRGKSYLLLTKRLKKDRWPGYGRRLTRCLST